jgi:hypothetical protein
MDNETGSNLSFAAWMASPAGRITRIVAGAALIAVGFAVGGGGGLIIGLVGIVPAAMGLSNRCLIAPLISAPWKGEDAADAVA